MAEDATLYDGTATVSGITELSHLLPENYTNLEGDIVAIGKRETAIDYDLGRRLDPMRTPMSVLPWLGWGISVPLWDEGWTDYRKRKIVANARFLHTLKGTAAGIREHLKYVDVAVHKIVTPPVKSFAGRSMTKAERETWLAQMPQLRLYKFLTRGNGKGQFFANHLFAGRGQGSKGGWSYRAAFRISEASLRIGVRGFYYDQGNLTPLTTAQVVSSEVSGVAETRYRVRVRGKRGNAFFCGEVVKKRGTFLGRKLLAGRIYTMVLNETYTYTADALQLNTVQPSLNPVDVRFQYVKERGVAVRASMFPQAESKYRSPGRQVLHGKFLPFTGARKRLYQRVYLHDPGRAKVLRGSRAFTGHCRLGIKPFTAEVSVLIVNKRNRLAPAGYCKGFLHKSRQKRLQDALKAISVAKAARDKVLVKTGLYKVPTLADGLPMDGSYRFGDRVLGA